MPKTIKYNGTQDNWPELPYTGKPSAWRRGQQEERSDAEAAALLGTGLFENLSDDAIGANQSAALVAAVDGGIFDAIPATASLGTLLVSFNTAPGAGTVSATRTSDGSLPSPDADDPNNVVKLPWIAGNGAIYDHIPASAIDLSAVTNFGVWAMATKRADGERYSMLKVLFGESTLNFTNFGQATITVRADGKWRLYTVNMDQATLGGGAWTKATPVARLRLREGDAGAATKRPQMTSAGETIYIGAWRNAPKQKAMAIIRFDDGLSNLYTSKTVNVGSTFTGKSGVTITAGSNYSMFDIVSAFGLPANAYVLTDLIGTSGFESVAGLKSLQGAGWDICFQSAANPVGGIGSGVRLLGPYGYNLVVPGRITSLSTSTGVCTTSGTEHGIGGTTTGQPFPVIAVGSDLPAELKAGETYYLFRVSATTFTIHSQAQGSIDGTTAKIIPATTGTLANWGFRYKGSANDHTAILAEFQRGYDWLVSNGFTSGAAHYAPNQGAWDAYTELAFFAFGKFETVSTTAIGGNSVASGASVPVFEPVTNAAAANDTTSATMGSIHASYINFNNVIQTDVAVSATEATVRARVREAITRGTVLCNYHHAQSFTTVLDLLWYLDELKMCSDAGLIYVGKVSDVWKRIKAARARIGA